jgi:hypothetical protein
MTCLKHHESCSLDPKIAPELELAKARVPKEIQGLQFVPWVGRDYGHDPLPGTRRLLILGESHYEWCKACWGESRQRGSDLTCRCVAERIVLDDNKSIQHWRNIEYALMANRPDRVDRQAFWHGVAYYNYVQSVVGFFAGGGRPPKPTAQMWRDAEATFLKVVEQLVPDLVVVLGFGLWKKLPNPTGRLTAICAIGKEIERCAYAIRGRKTVVACRVRHPAAGLGATWAPALNKAVAAL